jgi:hypothetical protein
MTLEAYLSRMLRVPAVDYGPAASTKQELKQELWSLLPANHLLHSSMPDEQVRFPTAIISRGAIRAKSRPRLSDRPQTTQ